MKNKELIPRQQNFESYKSYSGTFSMHFSLYFCGLISFCVNYFKRKSKKISRRPG